MKKFFEKLKALDDKKVKLIQIIGGILAGIIIWLAIVLTSNTEDQLLGFLFLAIALVILLGKRKVEKGTGWNMKVFSLAWVISMAVAIVGSLIYWIVTGKIDIGNIFG